MDAEQWFAEFLKLPEGERETVKDRIREWSEWDDLLYQEASEWLDSLSMDEQFKLFDAFGSIPEPQKPAIVKLTKWLVNKRRFAGKLELDDVMESLRCLRQDPYNMTGTRTFVENDQWWAWKKWKDQQ